MGKTWKEGVHSRQKQFSKLDLISYCEFRGYNILKDDALNVLYSIRQQVWKTQWWPQDWKRSVFIPIPKKGDALNKVLASIFPVLGYLISFHVKIHV